MSLINIQDCFFSLAKNRLIIPAFVCVWIVSDWKIKSDKCRFNQFHVCWLISFHKLSHNCAFIMVSSQLEWAGEIEILCWKQQLNSTPRQACCIICAEIIPIGICYCAAILNEINEKNETKNQCDYAVHRDCRLLDERKNGKTNKFFILLKCCRIPVYQKRVGQSCSLAMLCTAYNSLLYIRM